MPRSTLEPALSFWILTFRQRKEAYSNNAQAKQGSLQRCWTFPVFFPYPKLSCWSSTSGCEGTPFPFWLVFFQTVVFWRETQLTGALLSFSADRGDLFWTQKTCFCNNLSKKLHVLKAGSIHIIETSMSCWLILLHKHYQGARHSLHPSEPNQSSQKFPVSRRYFLHIVLTGSEEQSAWSERVQ